MKCIYENNTIVYFDKHDIPLLIKNKLIHGIKENSYISYNELNNKISSLIQPIDRYFQEKLDEVIEQEGIVIKDRHTFSDKLIDISDELATFMKIPINTKVYKGQVNSLINHFNLEYLNNNEQLKRLLKPNKVVNNIKTLFEEHILK
jgi:hypothetical protein